MDAYAEIMKSIADGHQKLYDPRNNFAVKELAKSPAPDIEAIGSATRTVYTAFKQQEVKYANTFDDLQQLAADFHNVGIVCKQYSAPQSVRKTVIY